MEMLTGYGVPFKTTQAEPGQYYKNLNTNDVYKCVGKHTVSATAVRDNGTCEYIWELAFTDPGRNRVSICANPELFDEFYEPVRFPKKIELQLPNVDFNTNGLGYVIYGGGIWFTADGNTVYISTDGITWEEHTVNITMGYTARVYANGVWLNVANSNKLYYSTDRCKTWTACSIDTTSPINELKHCNGHWYARSAGAQATYHSTDGKTWTKMSLPAVSGNYVYANGVYMVGDQTAQCKLYKSVDGLNFTEVTNVPSELAYGKAMYYFNGVWLACDGRSKKTGYSTDNGDTWAVIENCPVYNAMTQFGHRLISANITTGKTYVSEDGVTWNELNGLSSKVVNNIYVMGNVCVCSTSGDTFYYSLDLDTWYEGTIPGGAKSFNSRGSDGKVLMFNIRDRANNNKIMYAKMF